MPGMRIPFALALALASSLLVGCDDDGGSSDPDGTTSTATSGDTADPGDGTSATGDTANPTGDATATAPGDATSTSADTTMPGDTGGPDTVEMCGNLTCDPGELCSTCEVDCGPCEEPPVTECNDGIDNDGDGLVDWGFDTGCWSESDGTESAGARAEESGWTTFDPDANSQIIYVSSSEGDDGNDGLSPETAVATPMRGAELVRDGEYDFLLFKRGDTWRGMSVGDGRVQRRFKSGRDAAHPIVVSSYGESTVRPRFELDTHFIDDDGNARSNIAVIGLTFAAYRKDPGDPEFNGEDGGALRFVAAGSDGNLFEDNYLEYSEFVVQNGTNYEIRRNVVYRSYHVGTCAFNADGTPNPNGDNTFRPSGIFAGGVTGLLIEGNVWDENGWNPDVEDACATIYNHDLYLSGCSDLTVRDNLIMRASSIGVKMAANSPGASVNVTLENNLFAEGEIGISMGGNSDEPGRFLNGEIADNVFTDIGRAQPTGRTLTWYIGISDNVGTEIHGNLLVNQPMLGNTEGINLTGDDNDDVWVHDNTLHGMGRRALRVQAGSGFSNVRVENNTVSSDRDDACTVAHSGGFGGVSYSGNTYESAAQSDAVFCVDGDRNDLAGWVAASGETGASEATLTPPDAGRNLDAYAAHLGIGSTLPDFAAAARTLSRHTWRPELTAPAANNWIREGYGLPAK